MQIQNPHSTENQSLHELIHGANTGKCIPEVVIPIVGRVLGSVELLTGEQNKSLQEYVSRVFPELKAYANTSTSARIKKTVGSCALLLKNEEDVIQLYYEAYCIGDIETLFVLFDYLIGLGQDERVKNLLAYVWEEWKNTNTEIDEEKRSFLHSLSQYAFGISCDDIGLEMASILEGKTMSDYDPNILKYRISLRAPSEYSFALCELFEFYFTGNNYSITPRLLNSIHEYIESQISYLQKHQVIEPEMLRYLETSKCEDPHKQVGYNTFEGKTFFQLQNYLILAILYGDLIRAEHIISLLESNEDMQYSLADIVIDLSLIDNIEGEREEKTSERIVSEGVLSTFLRIYQGVEYAGVHARIYALMKKMTPLLSQETIRFHEVSTMSRTYRLNHSGIIRYYLPIVTEANMSLHNIPRVHILDTVVMTQKLQNPQSAIAVAYYSLEYFLLHGALPAIDEEFLMHTVQHWPMSPYVRSFFEECYNIPSIEENATNA